MNSTSLETLQQEVETSNGIAIMPGFNNERGFEFLVRTAKVFSTSSIVPKQFQGNLSNCTIALDMATRMNANPMMLMQNMYIVYGTPSFSAKFLIALFNSCGKFTSIEFEMVGEKNTDSWGYFAQSTEIATGRKMVGPTITIGLARQEGWYDKKSKDGGAASKWPTMPEKMLMYRAAAWMIDLFAPELALGVKTTEEMEDIIDVKANEKGVFQVIDTESEEIAIVSPIVPEKEIVSEGGTKDHVLDEEKEELPHEEENLTPPTETPTQQNDLGLD